MGRGSSKAGGGNSVKSIRVQSGEIVEFDNPLIYGKKDAAIDGNLRSALEAQEKKRLDSKIEFGAVYNEDGNIIGQEVRGGKDGLYMPAMDMDAGAAFTHNHPRSEGKGHMAEKYTIGGTFSEADLGVDGFADEGIKTYRASAAEGTYSITKNKNFDSKGFKNYVADVNSKRDSDYSKISTALDGDYLSGKMDYKTYIKSKSRQFNNYMVDLHNDYLAGQKKYGYTYTLERR